MGLIRFAGILFPGNGALPPKGLVMTWLMLLKSPETIPGTGTFVSAGNLLRGPGTFIARKEECLIADDRPTQRAAELVLLKRGDCSVDRSEVVFGVRYLIAQKLEGGTMDRVPAGFG